MSRAKWKGPYIDENYLKNRQQQKENYFKTIASRTSTILPKFIEKTVKIHNGKNFIEIFVTEEMVGHKFGEFSSTRKRFSFKKKKTKK